ncbi:MAG: C25 family cysteine peptidase, partial [Candidatus Cloacimonetes bacterium]|nr:C25 family cysteine peptidase [Candidatus Cloacimonadota bacterium]
MKKLLLVYLLALSLMLTAETVKINDSEFGVSVSSSDDYSTVINYNIDSFNAEKVNINGEIFYQISLNGEPLLLEAGNPSLPKIARSIMIADQSAMSVNVISSEYVEYNNFKIAPSKGNLTRDINPDDVPYTFSQAYSENDFYPAILADSNDPYILRDVRGLTVNVYPFAYNHVTQTLRVYHSMIVEVVNNGSYGINQKTRDSEKINAAFSEIYKTRFINYTTDRYEPMNEIGRMIVISHPDFLEAMQPFVEWKRQKGIQTEIVDFSTIGTSANQLKTYIQEQYDLNDGLAFVQLVGDAAQIPSLSASGGASDPSYALLEGNDNYPDIFVGRFSAETVAQVETQVLRTIHYERDMATTDTWIPGGIGIGSSQGAGTGDDGEADWVHLNNIRNKLLIDVEPFYTYTLVDQIYDNNGGNAGMVTASLNEGRSIINYTGHGSNTSWSSTGYSNTHINQLINDYKLPHIISVACKNGNFTFTTCFAEAWTRATNNTTGNPTGAVAIYASSINQSWAPPMAAQDEIADIMVGLST